MVETDSRTGLGHVIALLAQHSQRPRYAFLVLQLIADVVDPRGRAGPFVRNGAMTSTIRDWLVTGLMPISGRDRRRETMRARIQASIAKQLTGDAIADQALLDQMLESQALVVGRQNVSRAISDLVKAGLVTRHYAGYATDHVNRGAGRHAVYVLSPLAMAALGKGLAPPAPLALDARPLSVPMPGDSREGPPCVEHRALSVSLPLMHVEARQQIRTVG